MRGGKTGITAILLLAAAAWAAAAPPKKNPLQPVERSARAMSGRELYLAYCASCHGLEGKGDGPASEAMRMQPTDLTTLARKHGKFPALRVQRLLGGIEGLPAHGGKRMPVWGPVFLPVSPAGGEDAALIDRLVRYLESIQQPPVNP
jgi:mono/diheme cytochrome c family protein